MTDLDSGKLEQIRNLLAAYRDYYQAEFLLPKGTPKKIKHILDAYAETI